MNDDGLRNFTWRNGHRKIPTQVTQDATESKSHSLAMFAAIIEPDCQRVLAIKSHCRALMLLTRINYVKIEKVNDHSNTVLRTDGSCLFVIYMYHLHCHFSFDRIISTEWKRWDFLVCSKPWLIDWALVSKRILVIQSFNRNLLFHALNNAMVMCL